MDDKTIKEFRDSIKESEESFSQIGKQLEGWVIAANIGLLSFSAGFLQISDNLLIWTTLLLVSWICFGISTGLIIYQSINLLHIEDMTVKLLKKVTKDPSIPFKITQELTSDTEKLINKKEKHEPMAYYNKAIVWMFIGIVILTVFSAINIFSRNSKIKMESILRDREESIDLQMKEIELEKLKLEVKNI